MDPSLHLVVMKISSLGIPDSRMASPTSASLPYSIPLATCSHVREELTLCRVEVPEARLESGENMSRRLGLCAWRASLGRAKGYARNSMTITQLECAPHV